MKKFMGVIVLALVAFGTVTAKAEVEKFIQLGKDNLRPVFRLKFTPPAGWEANAEGTKHFGLATYAPKGQGFHEAPAIIYIRVSYNENGRPLDAFIDVSQERWKKAVPDTQVKRITDEKREGGQPDFRVYSVRNPSHPAQGYEMLAYGEDKDKDGNKYFVMISITAQSQKALDDAEKAYRAALRTH
jgi:hypothetical protein